MTAAAQVEQGERADVRTIVYGGIKLGVLTTVGVVTFALLARALDGTVETVVQAVLLVAGGVVFAFLPALWVRPRTADGIAWAALVGLLGALTFTVLDTALLRPFDLYHWTWDEIGGGSGFWYIPVWWMGSAFVAWLGAWIMAATRASAIGAIGTTLVLSIVLFGLLVVSVAPATSAVMALAFTLALVVHVPVAVVRSRK